MESQPIDPAAIDLPDYGSVSRTHRGNLSEVHLMVAGVSAAI